MEFCRQRYCKTDYFAFGDVCFFTSDITEPPFLDYLCAMIRGVVFDMDGVLVNNTPVHVEAFGIFCDRYGVTGWKEKLAGAYGMGNDDIMRLILPAELIQEKGLAALAAEKEAIYREIYTPTIRPVTGLRELLDRLRTAGVPCAVGSSGPRDNIAFVLDRCGIADCFAAIVDGEQVTHCKPDPEIYLTAAEKLGLAPSECLVFEDARAGIEAAHRAGVGRIVALATTLSADELADTAAERIIADFTEITSIEDLLN